jgi:hypothetical protein
MRHTMPKRTAAVVKGPRAVITIFIATTFVPIITFIVRVARTSSGPNLFSPGGKVPLWDMRRLSRFE